MDAWYLGPSLDHYRCNHYFVPETLAYRISGLAELFPQHCQVPFLSTNDHMKELTNEVVSTLKNMTAEKQRCVLTLFKSKLSNTTVQHERPAFLTSPCHAWILPEEDFQCVPQLRVPMQDQQRVATSAEQRVGTTWEITTMQDLCRMSNAPPIMNAPNPTTKRALKSTKRVHRRITRKNVPGTVTPITPTLPRRPVPTATAATPV